MDDLLLSVPIRGPDHRLTATLVRPKGGRVGHLIVCVHGGGCNGRYFDLAGFSFARAAVRRGFDLLLVNRPGFGGSDPPRSAYPIAEAALLLPALVEAATVQHMADTDHVSVLGHSIGGAVAIRWAASFPASLSALALSGIGAELSETARDWWRKARFRPQLELPTDFFFGPDGSYDWRGAVALRKVAEPWRFDEVREVFEDWPAAFREIAGDVRCPVHVRLAEYERIWSNDADALVSFERSLTNCRSTDSAVALGSGHLIELHRRGAELIEAQLDFFENAAQIPMLRGATGQSFGGIQ